MSNELRYPLALTLAQLNELAPLLDAAAAREGDPDAPIFALQDLVREARRAVVAKTFAVPLNDPETLMRAREQIQIISAAKDLQAVAFWWARAYGYVAALYGEGLIDQATERELDTEADAARDAWTEPSVRHNEAQEATR